MPLMTAASSILLVVDIQEKLVPVIETGPSVVANSGRLIGAARLLGVPVLFTEQNPGRLGPTVPALPTDACAVVAKMAFSAWPDIAPSIPEERAVVVAGCEAHVCVLQTVLALRAAGRRVHVVCDAIGSRRRESRDVAIRRMAAHGAEPVTTEMVVFEWLGSADHPAFRNVLALVK